MKILAIDTSLGTGSVAAADEGGLDERPLGTPGDHARLLMGALVDVAERRGFGRGAASIAAIGPADVIAVVRGPGSFTGLRVGITTAKALAWSTGARLVAVSAHDCIARQTSRLAGWPGGSMWIAFDAGRGEVAAAEACATVASPTGWTITPQPLQGVDAWVAGLSEGARVSGPAVIAFSAQLATRPDLALAPADACFASAADVAALAPLLVAAGLVADPHALVPDYLRPSYAEEQKIQG
jgi:tRNA threonylcarbamoyladenosine biosynthesis protein TsaB